jgi:DNA-binding IclR family transcriptional regulator
VRRLDGSVSVFHRLQHGGHVDLNLSSSGRVLLLVNSAAEVSQVLCELDAVRDELTRFQVAVTRGRGTTTVAASPLRRDAA